MFYFYLIWLFVAFLRFVLMLLSDLICIQITSPGGSPIRGKNAVRASRHALPLPSPPLHPVQSVTSPIPILTASLLISSSGPLNTTGHHTHPLSVIPSCGLIHCKSGLCKYSAEPCLGDSKPYCPGLLGQPHRRDLSATAVKPAKPWFPRLATEGVFL